MAGVKNNCGSVNPPLCESRAQGVKPLEALTILFSKQPTLTQIVFICKGKCYSNNPTKAFFEFF